MSADAPATDAFGPLRNFLEQETLSHFISEHHKPLELLKKGASTVGDAMKLLSNNKVLSAAILDEEGEYLGAVSVPDILRGLVRNLEANLGEGFLEDLSSLSAEELNSLGTFYASKPAESVLHEADLWMKGDANTTMMSVLREGFQIEQTRVHHRIYVCDPAKASSVHVSTGAPLQGTIYHSGELTQGGLGATVINIPVGSERENASAWVPTDVVTQLDFICLLAEKKLANVTATLEELELAKTVVGTVTEDTPALVAFHHMAMDHKSAVGLTDKAGKLVGSISVADLRDLPTDQFGLLLQPVSKLIKDGVFKSASLDVVKPTTTFADLIEQLATNRLQRVYVVGADGSAQSIITLTDVLRVVSGCSIPKARRSLDIQREFEEKKARETAAMQNGVDDDDEEDDDEEDA